jgi:glycogen debranching enzyme
VDLTNPDFIVRGRIELPRDTIHIARSKFLWQAGCYERFGIRNFTPDAQEIEIAFHFGADFADIFEVRGHARSRRGETRTRVSGSEVAYAYQGLDGTERRTVFRFDHAPDELDEEGALFRLDLPPGGRKSLFLTISCEEGADKREQPRRFLVCMREARRALRASTARAAAAETSNDILNEVLCRSMADLYMLLTDTEQGAFPYAGIPWFSTAFGRDALVTAMEMLWVDPAIAKGALQFLAARQATERKPEADSEPGKILHEMRAGEMARLGEVPFALYYGSVDSTPLFVVLAGMYLERTGDLRTIGRLWPSIQAALRWMDEYGDRDGDGFVEYAREGGNGLVNQGWKDSVDAVFHADGAYAEGPVALCEVQGYVYAAKRHAAKMAAALGRWELATTLDLQADALKAAFEEAFWCEEIGTYALALDGRKQQCKVRSSNAGQVLFSGIAAPERAQAVADQLLGHEFFTGWGIRTIGVSEIRYNPMSYHNGSVWPHDNALIGLGLSRYGLNQHLQRLFSGIFETAAYMDLRRLPELFCGFRRSPGKGPTFYPVACSPQAWSCAAPFALLQACLGLEFDCAADCLRFRQPRLPAFLDEVTLRNLAIGDSRLDVLLRRHGPEVSVNVLRRHGSAQVSVTL